MHADTADLLEEWLTLLAERGESEAFAHIKRLKNNATYGRENGEKS